ncbi:MAG TPA: CHAD domain-containing protein [Thiobacillus sp.]
MNTSQAVEIELKLALPPQQAEAFLKLMARRRGEPVQNKLLTRYFDTPDFDLGQQGVALRVRKIGRRWLQTLKTEGERQGGLSKRAEYEMAVSGDTPDWGRFPAVALARVPESLRGHLVPVFETHFTRTAWLVSGIGGSKIEVALDVGEVRTLANSRAGKRSQSICEIELELKAGKPEALFALAHDWAMKLDCLPLDVSKAERGAGLARGLSAMPVKFKRAELTDDMTVEAGFGAMMQACLTQFQANLPGVLGVEDPEYVHQTRVALRRLKVLLRLYRKVCVLPIALQESLREIDKALGPARDWDVLCDETLPAIAPHFDDTQTWLFGQGGLEAHRSEARAIMRENLGRARPGAWILALQRWLMRQAWRSSAHEGRKPVAKDGDKQHGLQQMALDAWARRMLKKGHRQLVRGAYKRVPADPVNRHALRIEIKYQRYASDLFSTLLGNREQARYQTAIQSLQAGLGQMNDASVAIRLISESTVDMGKMRPFVLGWLAAKQTGISKREIDQKLKSFIKMPACW